MADGSDRSGIQVIARAGAILRMLEDRPSGLSLAEIATGVGLPRSTVQRIVGALAEEQLTTAPSARTRVRLGPALVRLAAAAEVDVQVLARPLLQDLSRTTDETVDLSMLRGDSVVFIEQVLAPQRLMAVSAVGEVFPLYCTANGKAMLAAMSDETRQEALPRRLRAYTSNTITDRKALDANLATVRETGLAWDLEEHTEDVSAVGAAFEDNFGRRYAISIPAPTSRFDRKREALGQQLLIARDRLVEQLSGGARP